MSSTVLNSEPQTPLKPMSENQLEFVFTIGIEGTGHHFMDTIYKSSPDYNTMVKWGFRPYLQAAIDALYQQRSKGGIWNQACREEMSYQKIIQKGWQLKLSEVDMTKKATPMANATNVYLKIGKKIKDFDTMAKHITLVSQFKEMQGIYDRNTANRPQPLRVPLSAFLMEESSRKSYGMLSYPNFRDECYKLQYPVLEMLYDACQEAGVQCSHAYVYRHPLDVLTSTTIKRRFNSPGMVLAAHLYASHLKLIETQLNSYPSRNRGCLGFFDEDPSRLQEWKDTLKSMWGFGQQSNSFNNVIDETYRIPSHFRTSTSTNIVAEEVEGVFPEEHLPYLKVFLKAHEKTLAVCRQSIVV